MCRTETLLKASHWYDERDTSARRDGIVFLMMLLFQKLYGDRTLWDDIYFLNQVREGRFLSWRSSHVGCSSNPSCVSSPSLRTSSENKTPRCRWRRTSNWSRSLFGSVTSCRKVRNVSNRGRFCAQFFSGRFSQLA